MNEIDSGFWTILLQILSYFGVFLIVLLLVFVVTATTNIILRRINNVWYLKFRNIVNKAVLNSSEIKGLVKNFEKLINSLFSALSGIIGSLASLITATFTMSTSLIIIPLDLITKLTTKFTNFMNNLIKDKNETSQKNDDEVIEILEKKSKETLLDKQLRDKSKGSNNE